MTAILAENTDVRDAAAIDSGEWTDRPLLAVDGRDDQFQVVFRQSALDAIHLHGQTRTDVELCGVLIGTGHRDRHGPYLLVEHAIPAAAANSKSTNVTFTADAWHGIQTVMDRDFPDKKMIGWYHTHPGFGIFLSDMDVFICDNFFNLPWQIAFVYDPLGGDEGNFVWRDGRPTREPVLLEDDVTPAAASVPLMPLAEAMTGGDPVGGDPIGGDPIGGDPRIPESPWATGPLVLPAFSELVASAAADDAAAGVTPYIAPVSPVADADEPATSPEAVVRLQSQVIELMERVRRLEHRQRLAGIILLSLFVFAAALTVTLWPTPSAPTQPLSTPPSATTPAALPIAPRPNSGPVRPPLPARGH